MSKPEDKIQPQVIYCAPEPEVIEKYARDICRRLEQHHGQAYARPEVVTGFTAFLKVAAQIYANYLTRQQNKQAVKAQ